MLDRGLRQAELCILNAPFEERGWERAVEAVADATGSHAAQLLGLGGPLLLPLNVFVGAPSDYRHYIANAELHGRCNWRVGSTTVPMAIQHESDYAAYRLTNDTADYDDAASDMDIPYGCQSALLLDSQHMIGLAALRSRRDGPSTAETLSRFAYLRRHMWRAVQMQIALDGEASELMVGELERLRGATLLLDRHGCIAALTPAAERLFEEGGPLQLAGLGVELSDPTENKQFLRLMAKLLRHDPAVGIVQMSVGCSGEVSGGRWRLFLTRLPQGRDHGLGFEPHMALTFKPVSQSATLP